MKYIRYIIIGLFISTLTHTLAQPVADIWKKLPQNIYPTIDSIARLDMIDLYHAGIPAQAKTRLGDTAKLISMSDTYLLLRTSQSSTLQIKCLNIKKEKIYAFITTVEGPIANSHIDLYDEHWNKLPLEKHFTPPTVDNFIHNIDNTIEAHNNISREILIPAIQYMMNDTTNDIIAIPTFMQTLDKESRERIKPHIMPHIKIEWDGKKWKRKR